LFSSKDVLVNISEGMPTEFCNYNVYKPNCLLWHIKTNV